MSPVGTTPVNFRKDQLAETALLALDDLYPDGWHLKVANFRLDADLGRIVPTLEVLVVVETR